MFTFVSSLFAAVWKSRTASQSESPSTCPRAETFLRTATGKRRG
ncbi:hypothetical protein B1H56_10450 [Christensenella minuta]|nr:hypothetical protein B1H56_10450 [Christensenella minuta]